MGSSPPSMAQAKEVGECKNQSHSFGHLAFDFSSQTWIQRHTHFVPESKHSPRISMRNELT